MKFLSILFLVCSFSSFGQLISGDLMNEGRKLTTASDFTITGRETGEIFYELAVNREGKVTSARLLGDKTTVVSTPPKVKAKDLVMKLRFTPGTHFPAFHHVVVKVKVLKQTEEPVYDFNID